MSRLAVAGAVLVTAILIAFASGYGYHRDELYFLAAGEHLDWAYADQGPLTPLIARAMSGIAADSLTMLRLPAAAAAGLIVWLCAMIACELGGSRRAQWIAAAAAGAAGLILFDGHLLSTSTFDLLVWTAAAWLTVRAVLRGDDRLWLAVGAVIGIGLLNKPLPAFLVIGMLIGVAIAGPRRLLRSPWVWGGAAIALALWSPWLIWQASNGWPQIDVSRSIAAGGSTSSEPWYLILPFQFLLASPPLAPIWIAGLVGLFREPSLRDVRFLAWAWVALALIFMATGGKPYYLAGLLGLLIGAGAVSVDRWLERGRRRARAALLGLALGSSAAVALVIALPLLPTGDTGPVLALNEDVGETIGWPRFAETVAGVARETGDDAVILTRNYGEAGAIDRYGPDLGLPRAYSGHNAYFDWGPPPDRDAQAVVIGYGLDQLEPWFAGCAEAATIDNAEDVDNEEQGAAVIVCDGPREPWSQLWPRLRRLG